MTVTNRDITRAVTKQCQAVAKLLPDTTQDEVLKALGAATDTIWSGWFCPNEDVPSLCTADLECRTEACIRIIRSAPAWDDTSVIYDHMSPGAMASVAWVALRNCLRQALADLGYDLHAEYPLAKVIHEELTGRRMSQEKFGNWCLATFQADPILDLVVELSAWGLSESQLANLLATQGTLPQPFTVALRNKYRTFHLTTSE
jgi:hypothetical protein